MHEPILHACGGRAKSTPYTAPPVIFDAKICIVASHCPNQARPHSLPRIRPADRTMDDPSFPVIEQPISSVAKAHAEISVLAPRASPCKTSVEPLHFHKRLSPKSHVAARQMIDLLNRHRCRIKPRPPQVSTASHSGLEQVFRIVGRNATSNASHSIL